MDGYLLRNPPTHAETASSAKDGIITKHTYGV